jgi:hypothetical protein
VQAVDGPSDLLRIEFKPAFDEISSIGEPERAWSPLLGEAAM